MTAEDRAIQEIEAEDEAALAQVAAEMGPPPESGRLSAREQVELWGQTDPSVDYETLRQRLVMEGLPPEEAQTLAIAQEYPDIVPLLAQPTGDLEMADMLASLAERPYRLAILEGIDDPEEQVKTAERLDREWQKMLAERDAMLLAPVEGG